MTYIDYKNKVVFNGSDLGKEYSAKRVTERIAQNMIKAQRTPLLPKMHRTNLVLPKKDVIQDFADEKENNITLEKAIELVMNPVNENNYLPYQLLQKKRKKKKHLLHL